MWRERTQQLKKIREEAGKPAKTKDIERDITNEQAEALSKRITDTVREMYNKKEKLNVSKIWNLKNKTFPKGKDPTNAVLIGDKGEINN